MKRTIFILAAMLGMLNVPEAVAQHTKSIIPGVSIDNFDMSRNGKYLTVEMGIDMAGLDVNSNRAVLPAGYTAVGQRDRLAGPAVGGCLWTPPVLLLCT